MEMPRNNGAERKMSGDGARPLRLFISYSRSDMAVADALVNVLESEGFEVLIDRRDLTFAVEWQRVLQGFIVQAHAGVWLVSERSVSSRWCAPVPLRDTRTKAGPCPRNRTHAPRFRQASH